VAKNGVAEGKLGTMSRTAETKKRNKQQADEIFRKVSGLS
jgi:hypothetical protein